MGGVPSLGRLDDRIRRLAGLQGPARSVRLLIVSSGLLPLVGGGVHHVRQLPVRVYQRRRAGAGLECGLDHRAPRPLLHPVQRAVHRVGGDRRAASLPERETDGRLRLVDHPAQCALAQPGVGVPPAHIAVIAGEPDLLDVLGRVRGRVLPERRPERAAHLVQGHGMAGVGDPLVEDHVQELVALPGVEQVRHTDVTGDAERTHRVPHPDEGDRDVCGVRVVGQGQLVVLAAPGREHRLRARALAGLPRGAQGFSTAA